MIKHKVFISYCHADDAAVNEFIKYFCDDKGIFTPKIVGKDYDTIINSYNSDYIMRKIREDYLTDSTVTIVLIGKETYKRKYVDWEIASTLRDDKCNKRSGLLGIFLPGESNSKVPPRLQDNIDCGYAKIYSYPSYDSEKLKKWIEDAYERRNDYYYNVNNSQELYKNNI